MFDPYNSRAGIDVVVKPEYCWAYELGAKTDWFENRLRVNLAAFYSDYEDLQEKTYIPEAVMMGTQNAGSAEIKGIELEVLARPSQGWTINGSASYLDAEYKDFSVEDPIMGGGSGCLWKPDDLCS